MQTTTYKPLISLGVAAVGGTATMGVSPLDAQRLKIIVTGHGPATNLFSPIPQPGAPLSAMAALDQAAAVAIMPSELGLLGSGVCFTCFLSPPPRADTPCCMHPACSDVKPFGSIWCAVPLHSVVGVLCDVLKKCKQRFHTPQSPRATYSPRRLSPSNGLVRESHSAT